MANTAGLTIGDDTSGQSNDFSVTNSPIPAKTKGVVAIKTGVLDEQPTAKPNLVCWTKSKPDWLDISHPKVSFEENPN